MVKHHGVNTSREIKKIVTEFGADLVGIAPVERFYDAPKGFRPTDILMTAKAVIAYAKRFPDGVFASESPVPYTFASSVVLQEVFTIAYKLTLRLEDYGVTAVPIPSEPYEYWVEEKREGRGIMSLKHIGYLAGLGVLGRNTLLINEHYGNLITLGAVLVDVSFEGDPIAQYTPCGENCQACIRSCPSGALDGIAVDQKKCREKSNVVTLKGYTLYTCNICRKVCPCRKGIEKKTAQQIIHENVPDANRNRILS